MKVYTMNKMAFPRQVSLALIISLFCLQILWCVVTIFFINNEDLKIGLPFLSSSADLWTCQVDCCKLEGCFLFQHHLKEQHYKYLFMDMLACRSCTHVLKKKTFASALRKIEKDLFYASWHIGIWH